MAIRLALPLLFCQRRSFRGDAQVWLKGLKPSPIIIGEENIPQKAPFLLVINHYHRQNYKIWWSALAASALIPVEIHWVMTEAWTFPNQPWGRLLEAISRQIFRRIAQVYGFFLMPPMPPRPWEIEARARSVRNILDNIRKHPDSALGLAPEGGDSKSGALEIPAPGVGRFLLHLASLGLPIYPLGIYESEAALCLNFGKVIHLDYRSNGTPEERDCWGIRVVMQALADLLPLHLRGVFYGNQSEIRS